MSYSSHPILQNTHIFFAQIGSRYIDIDQPYPIEICGDLADPSTRGDAFVSWARYLLDQVGSKITLDKPLLTHSARARNGSARRQVPSPHWSASLFTSLGEGLME